MPLSRASLQEEMFGGLPGHVGDGLRARNCIALEVAALVPQRKRPEAFAPGHVITRPNSLSHIRWADDLLLRSRGAARVFARGGCAFR